MTELFPTLVDAKITHCWSGYIAYTKDTLPHLGCQNGIWYAAGYCGTGVSRSTWFGHKVAQKILASQDGETPFDDLDFSPFQGRWAAPVGVAAVESWYRLKDTFDK
jgi:glycine/D-amino acid oxidase-like deaminating enzyme